MAAYEEIRCSQCTNSAMAEKAFNGVYPPSGWYEKKGNYFCSKGCKDRFYAASESEKLEKNTKSPEVESPKSGTENKPRGMFGGITNEMFSSLISSADSEEKQLREAIDHITRMTFSSDPSELSNQLNELASTGASSDKFRNGKPLKKTCYEKMEFGIMKLRQAGASAEADFFEKKRKSIKPGWF
jgi:hypothetical protein